MNAIAKITDVNASVEGWRDDLSRVMASDVDPDKFIAAVTTALTLNPDIVRECTAESIKNACIKAAYDGLRPDGKEGALVAYYNKDIRAKEAAWMPMVYGLRKKAKDHDDIIITAREVRRGDKFEVVYGLREDLTHVPLLAESKRGPIIATYAVFRRGDEVLHFEVMTKEDIDQVRAASKAPNSPAWNNWYGEMGKKAAANRGSKSVPMSDAVRQVIDRDNDHYDLNGIKDVTPQRTPLGQALQAGKSAATEGFSPDNVTKALEDNSQQPMEIIDRETGEVIEVNQSEAQPGTAAKTTPSGNKGDEPAASAKPASKDVGGAGEPASEQARPQNSSSSPAPSGDDKGGDAAPDSPRVSAAQFMAYHSAVARMASEENVRKANTKFWETAGFKPSRPDDRQLFSDILTNHVGRANKQLDAAELAANIKKWVADITGETVE